MEQMESSSLMEEKDAGTNAVPLRGKRRSRKIYKNPWIITSAVFFLVLLIVAGLFLQGLALLPVSNDGLQEVTTTVTHPDPALLEQVGIGNTNKTMHYINSEPLTGPDGKAVFVFLGAEYCPFCAAQRWAAIVALSRFGTFGQLTPITTVEGGIPSFSFHEIAYHSDYIQLQAKEIQDGRFPFPQEYDKLTQQQLQLLKTYDSKPATQIPFVDINNKYASAGSYYEPDNLHVSSYRDINDQLKNPQSKIAQSIYGSANYLTAAVCEVTDNKPASVCTSSLIVNMQQLLPR